MMYVIPIEFATPAYDQTIALRDRILRQPLGLDFKPKDLSQEFAYTHLACYHEDGRLLGCLTMVPLNDQRVKMQQVAVAETWQRKGVGKQLVAASEVYAQKAGFDCIELNARDIAIPFYEKLNYQKVGKPFTEVSIKHYKMEKLLS
ncbi:MAG: GNAT family N-acetyltransferase [Bacteroidota bacterium]